MSRDEDGERDTNVRLHRLKGYTTSFPLGLREELGLSQSSQKKDKRHAFRARIIRSTHHLDDTFKIHSYFMKTISIIGMINPLQKGEKKRKKM